MPQAHLRPAGVPPPTCAKWVCQAEWWARMKSMAGGRVSHQSMMACAPLKKCQGWRVGHGLRAKKLHHRCSSIHTGATTICAH